MRSVIDRNVAMQLMTVQIQSTANYLLPQPTGTKI